MIDRRSISPAEQVSVLHRCRQVPGVQTRSSVLLILITALGNRAASGRGTSAFLWPGSSNQRVRGLP
jgi:hypothetical protein